VGNLEDILLAQAIGSPLECFYMHSVDGERYRIRVITFIAGWGDVGFHQVVRNNETKTPNIDALAGEGVILDRQYVSSECTPSRSSFFSGRLPVHVQQTLDNPEVPNSGIPRNMTVIGSKMKEGGFATHVVGKWDIGMATPSHTPEGRGFDSSLIYFEHKNDYWTQAAMQTQCTDYGQIWDLWDTGRPAWSMNGTSYEEFMFHERVYTIIDEHNFEEQPLFLVYTPHIVHCPLQVPELWLDQFGWVTDDESLCAAQTPYIFPGSTNSSYRCRSQYEAMVALLDDVIGNLTGLIKQKGVWDDTLMVLSTDNGGPLVIQESGASNSPLRGGKYRCAQQKYFASGVIDTRVFTAVIGKAASAGLRSYPVVICPQRYKARRNPVSYT
jgi:arylsulfatase B